MKGLVQKVAHRMGYTVRSNNKPISEDSRYSDLEKEFCAFCEDVKDYTQTNPERLYAVYQATHYVTQYDIEGSFVECGVWRGGSSMMFAKTAIRLGSTDRNMFLYDTYEGMSQPTEKDVSIDSVAASAIWTPDLCFASLEEVQANIRKTGYPEDKVQYIRGKVEETIPTTVPDRIAILRLDTDWYESTYHELQHLYPLLSPGGVLIIDDYGFWRGAKEAVDRYFQELGKPLYLNRIDSTARVAIKLA